MTSLLLGVVEQNWRQTTKKACNCMMRGVGSNQNEEDLCSFPGSHLYHKEPSKPQDVSKCVHNDKSWFLKGFHEWIKPAQTSIG